MFIFFRAKPIVEWEELQEDIIVLAARMDMIGEWETVRYLIQAMDKEMEHLIICQFAAKLLVEIKYADKSLVRECRNMTLDNEQEIFTAIDKAIKSIPDV